MNHMTTTSLCRINVDRRSNSTWRLSKTGSTYISTYRHDREFVPNLNHMPTTSPCRRNFHLHSNPTWQSSIPEILISTLSVTMETPFQSRIICPHPRNYHKFDRQPNSIWRSSKPEVFISSLTIMI